LKEKYYHNIELLKVAEERNFFLPKKHYLATLDMAKLDNDFKKMYTTPYMYPNEEKYQMALQALKAIVTPYFSGSCKLTPDEAIDVAAKSTASGALFKQLGFTTKRQVFEHLRPHLDNMLSNIALGKFVETLWEASPKIEIRSLEKIINDDLEKRKQRTFLCCDVLTYIIGLILYYDQKTRSLKMSNNHEGFSVGSSIFYGGWHEIALNLLKNGSKTFRCYDIKHMEASISPRIMEDIYEIRNSFLPNDKFTENLKEWYLANYIYSKVIDMHGQIGMKIGKISSGGPNTIDDNTLTLLLIQLYHFSLSSDSVSEILEKHSSISRENMGDDSIQEDVEIWTKPYDYIKTSKEMGFQLEEESYGSIFESTFLNFKFQFNINYSMFTFVPNYDKLFAGLYYYRKNDSWRLTLAKLCAMRVLCYTSKKHLEAIDYFIDYIWENHDNDLRLEKKLDDKITYNSLRSLKISNERIEILLFGLESKGPDEVYTSDIDLVFELSQLY